MGLSDYSRRQLLKALDKLNERHISKMFSQPVNPETDACPNYFEIIKNPMDLGTIRQKLLENKYETVDEFKSDVNLVWDNTIKYNGKKSIISHLAKDLSIEFDKLTKWITGDDDIDWLNKYNEIRLFNAQTKYITTPIPVEKKPPPPPAPQIVQPEPTPPTPAPPAPAQPEAPVKVSRPRGRPSKKMLAELEAQRQAQLNLENQNKSEITEPPREIKLIPKEKHLSLDQKSRLARDINALTDPVHIEQVALFIRHHEPQYYVDGSVEADLVNFQESNCIGLKKLVDFISGSFHH